jgi:hypothetical protein
VRVDSAAVSADPAPVLDLVRIVGRNVLFPCTPPLEDALTLQPAT